MKKGVTAHDLFTLKYNIVKYRIHILHFKLKYLLPTQLTFNHLDLRDETTKQKLTDLNQQQEMALY